MKFFHGNVVLRFVVLSPVSYTTPPLTWNFPFALASRRKT
jgi:hypothetical protein